MRVRARWRIGLGGVALATLSGMAVTPSASAAGVTLPPVHGRFDYQIGGAYRPMTSVDIVDRDRHDAPAAGRYSICYVNAFQTQPEENRWWHRHHPHLLLRDATGHLVTDPGWPGEILLDTSTSTKRQALARVVGHWIAGCETKGFRGVEPDNLDSYTRSHHVLTVSDNLAYARLLVRRGHDEGLAVAQKNGAGIAARAKRVAGFDFAIAEECPVSRACHAYRDTYGRHVIEIEYTDNGAQAFRTSCARRGAAISVVLRDRGVVARGRSGYVEKWCP
jgi:hypothetical protein